jgi:hypothetical protein
VPAISLLSYCYLLSWRKFQYRRVSDSLHIRADASSSDTAILYLSQRSDIGMDERLLLL